MTDWQPEDDGWRHCLRCQRFFLSDPRVPGMVKSAANVQRNLKIPAEKVLAAALRRIHAAHHD